MIHKSSKTPVIIVVALYLLSSAACLAVDMETEASQLIGLLDLPSGATVAEAGAGNGDFTIIVARHLLPDGRVLSNEISERGVSRIRSNVSRAGLDNITVIRGNAQATNFPAACCNAIFMRKVYHHFTNPTAMVANIKASLLPGGRLAVIDFPPIRGSGRVRGVPESRGGHGIVSSQVVEELQRAGFVVEHQIDSWNGRDYCIIMRMPTRAATAGY